MLKKVLFLLLVISTSTLSSQVQWADTLIGFSSEFNYKTAPVQYRAKQTLGEPSILPSFGSSPCAWASDKPNGGSEWIEVGYTNPQQVAEIYINENYNAGAVKEVFLKDIDNKYHSVFIEKEVKPIQNGRLLKIQTPLTSYLVQSVKIQLETSTVKGHNQIDAIGISATSSNYDITINQLDDISEIEIENLGDKINSPYDELCPVISPDGKKLFFTRQNHPQNVVPKNQDIWLSELTDTGFTTAKNLGAPLNNKSNNSLTSITPDGQKAILLNKYLPDGTTTKGLSEALISDSIWEVPTEIKIDDYYNDSKYGEYYLTNTGNVLLMTVQRKNGYGGKDVYYSLKKEDDTWTSPVNLGPVVNTASNETSPFLAADNRTLYYSTSGYPGFGGRDIFVTKRIGDSWDNWTTPVNLGKYLNTPNFDAYYSLPASGDYVYFVSYRKEGVGKADIYRAKLPQALKPNPVVLVQGKVFNRKDSSYLSSKIVYYSLTSNKPVGEAVSNPQTGEYKIVLPAGDNYGFSANKVNFLPVSSSLDLETLTKYEEKNVDLFLVPIEKDASLVLNNIYFDVDKATLRKESFVELDALAKIIKQQPNIKIEISGHTDSDGSDEYNLNLSLNRAKSVTEYLKSLGVSDKKIVSKGYGESNPIAPNTSDENKQKNRRVEFKVVEFKK